MSERPFADPRVTAVFANYPDHIREKLLFLRELIFATAVATEGIGELEETLKWGEPSYLTSQTKSGSTVRIDWKEKLPEQYAMYFKCTTNLVETFREKYPTEFKYGGNRSIIFDMDDDIPVEELRDCIALALTYHLRKKVSKRNR